MITSSSSNTHTVQVPAEADGMRLDLWLAQRLNVSRNKVQKALRDERVFSGEKAITVAKSPVSAQEIYTVCLEEKASRRTEAQNIPLNIVYEDDDLLVLNKPAGLVVHPGAGNRDQTLVNGLLAHCQKLSTANGDERPGIVHRLDKDTSGLLVVAKRDSVHLALQQQFQQRTIQRCYQALVWGMVSPPTGQIERGIMRHPRHPQKMVSTTGSRGRYALTHYRLIRHYQDNGTVPCSLIECRLETGRTHQIRVHCLDLGHPLVGDPLYGRKRSAGKSLIRQHLVAFPRQALHAKTLGFFHPVQQKDLFFEADVPADYADLLMRIAAPS